MFGACSVYDDVLPNGVAPLGGSGGESATGGSAGSSSPQAGIDAGGASGSAGGVGKAGEATAAGGAAGIGNGGRAGVSGAASTQGGEPPMGDGVSIDDMEDGDAQLTREDSRNGYWYTGSDDSATAVIVPPKDAYTMIELPDGDRSASVYSAHLKATGCKGWGSVLGCNFIEQATKVMPYDASQFCGVQFWGKAAAAVSVRFSVPDVDTHPEGGVCQPTGPSNQACYDHFNTSFTFTTAWKSFSAKFTELQQTSSGYHPADGKFKADQVFSLEWALPGTTGNTYEIWIDDLQFLPCN
jgi:hypothetical protein